MTVDRYPSLGRRFNKSKLLDSVVKAESRIFLLQCDLIRSVFFHISTLEYAYIEGEVVSFPAGTRVFGSGKLYSVARFT